MFNVIVWHARLGASRQPGPQCLHGEQRANGVDLKVLPQPSRVHIRKRVQVLVASHHQQQRDLPGSARANIQFQREHLVSVLPRRVLEQCHTV